MAFDFMSPLGGNADIRRRLLMAQQQNRAGLGFFPVFGQARPNMAQDDVTALAHTFFQGISGGDTPGFLDQLFSSESPFTPPAAGPSPDIPAPAHAGTLIVREHGHHTRAGDNMNAQKLAVARMNRAARGAAGVNRPSGNNHFRPAPFHPLPPAPTRAGTLMVSGHHGQGHREHPVFHPGREHPRMVHPIVRNIIRPIPMGVRRAQSVRSTRPSPARFMQSISSRARFI